MPIVMCSVLANEYIDKEAELQGACALPNLQAGTSKSRKVGTCPVPLSL